MPVSEVSSQKANIVPKNTLNLIREISVSVYCGLSLLASAETLFSFEFSTIKGIYVTAKLMGFGY